MSDLDTLTNFETCVVHQHQCRAADLMATAMPRAPELLATLGRTLGPADCPSAGGPKPR